MDEGKKRKKKIIITSDTICHGKVNIQYFLLDRTLVEDNQVYDGNLTLGRRVAICLFFYPFKVFFF